MNIEQPGHDDVRKRHWSGYYCCCPCKGLQCSAEAEKGQRKSSTAQQQVQQRLDGQQRRRFLKGEDGGGADCAVIVTQLTMEFDTCWCFEGKMIDWI